jgi:hypothetical protein
MYLKEKGMMVWIEFHRLRTESSGRCCGHSHEPSGFIKGGKYLYQLGYYHLLSKGPAPWS